MMQDRRSFPPLAALLLFLLLPLADQGAQASAQRLAGDGPAAEPVDEARVAELSAEVDALFERWHRPDSPGAAVVVLHRDDVVHRAGYGMASLEHGVPIRPGTVFDIASVSKQFGAWAIAVLEAEGSVGLDDDVRDYVPELPDFGSTITLRHLVHHTSGLRDWPGALSMAGWSYEDVLSFDQILRMAFEQRDLNFAPGEDYAYSNTGYNVLAEVVARVSGSSFRSWMDERLFRPLGMHRTHFHDDHREVVPDRADSYRPEPDGRWLRVTNNLTALGSSSLFTTADDLTRWVRYLHDPDPAVGGPGVVERMHERGVLNGGDTIDYAFGQNWGAYRGLRVATHGGSWAGFRTVLQRFPDQDFAVVILANAADMNPSALAREIAEIYLADDLGPPAVVDESSGEADRDAAADPWQPTAEELEAFEGEYRAVEFPSVYRLEVTGDVLVARHFRTGDRPLRAAGPDRFQAPGFGEVAFERGPDGEVTGFTANSVRIRGLRFERVRD
jgi:CubicO group peptidase (beta-lactamase class C family)